MRQWCNITDNRDLKADLGECTHGGLTTTSRTLDINLNTLQTMLLRLACSLLSSELCRKRRTLTGTLEARDKVLLKLNVAESALDAVLALLPAAKSPTVSRLASGDVAVESVVPKRGINTLIPDLIDAGASDLLEIPISKIIH